MPRVDVTKYKLRSATIMREQGEKRLATAHKRLADATRKPIDPTETIRRRAT